MADDEGDDRQVRPFADWLIDQRGGFAAQELSDSFNELLEAVTLHGKPGTLTFVVRVKPGAADQPTVLITDEVKVSKPTADRPTAIFFLDDNFNPHRHDPRQQRLPLRELETPAAPRYRSVDPDTGEISG